MTSWTDRASRWRVIVACIVLASLPAWGASRAGSAAGSSKTGATPRGSGLAGPIKDFRLPEFDANGQKKSEIFGDLAEPLDESRMKITGLRIVLFKDGVQEGIITAKDCIFDRKEKNALSNSEMSIEKGNMVVTGRGFRWNPDGQHLEILNNVRVVLKDAKIWAKELTAYEKQ